MKFEIATFTLPGDREYNEDYFAVTGDENNKCFILADGLGGHGRGEVASQLVCDVATKNFNSDNNIGMDRLFEISQKALLDLQEAEHAPDEMKTTMNIVTVIGKQLNWGHVGDSRTYIFKNGKIKVRTKDHSVPQMLVNLGEIKESEIRHHPDRSRLLRVMGNPWDKPAYVIEKPLKASKKQAVLMCSDGFWELIEDEDMEKLLKKSSSPDEWLKSMAAIVKENGKGINMDNYTAVAVWIS